MSQTPPDRQRIDKWLWHARLVRTRSAAAGLAGEGRMRINGLRIAAPSRCVRPGDVVTVALARVRVLRVVGFSDRRGAAAAAQALYEDITPSTIAVSATPELANRRRGGRPTKRDRRAIDKLTLRHDI